MKKRQKVLVAMSGGVDSSYAAFLLRKKGYEVIGVFMKVGKNYQDAFKAAKNVSDYLGVRLYSVNVNHVFEKEVIDYFTTSYEKGLTPNPCVRCNKLIKFGELFKLMRSIGCDFLATGHYVRIAKQLMSHEIRKGVDITKDQTYFLYNLKYEQLPYLLFPLGGLKKEIIKKKAAKEKIPFLSSESQDICFLDSDHNEYLKDVINLKPGEIRNKKNDVLGIHNGLPLYTIGQRKGIELGGTGPYYVLNKDAKHNVLYVTEDRDDKLLYRSRFGIEHVNWINPDKISLPLAVQVVFRYRHESVDCAVQEKSGGLEVVLKEPQRAITEGQSAVFYDGEKMLGGGVIAL